MKRQTTTQRAEAIAEKTSDAYSVDRYASWTQVARALLLAGYDENETEAIMRSKWTRWAADDRGYSTNCPARAVVTFASRQSAASLREIVEGTFPEVRQARLDKEAAEPFRAAQDHLAEENRAAFNRNYR